MNSELKKMNRTMNVILLFLVTALYFTSYYIFAPILPLYIDFLGGDERVVGLLVGLLSAAAVIFKVVCGRLVRRKGSPFVLRLGLVIIAVVPALYIPKFGFSFLGVVRIINALGMAGFIMGSQSLLASFAQPHNRGMLFGIYSAVTGLGMMAGPALGLYLVDVVGFTNLFWITSGIGFMALVGSIFLESPTQSQTVETLEGTVESYSSWANRSLVTISGVMLSVSMVLGATSSFLTLHAIQVGISNPAAFFVIFAGMFTVGGSLSGYGSDRLGRGAVVIPGFFVLIFGLFTLSGMSGQLSLIVSAASSGLGFGVINTVLMAMVSDVSSKDEFPQAMAFFSNAFDVGFVIGSMGLGIVAAYSYSAVWLTLAGTSIIGLIVFYMFSKRKQPSADVQS